MSKIEAAILAQERLGQKVWPIDFDDRVGVRGCTAIKIAERLLKEGKIKEFHNGTQWTKIGNNWDGSNKMGMVFEGWIVLHPKA